MHELVQLEWLFVAIIISMHQLNLCTHQERIIYFVDDPLLVYIMNDFFLLADEHIDEMARTFCNQSCNGVA